MISQSLILTLTLAQPCNSMATGPLPPPTLVDVPYGRLNDPYTFVDFYLPSPSFMPVGIVIEIHGGGFWNGDKSQFAQYEQQTYQGISAGFIEECWARGLAVASIQYHLVEPPSTSSASSCIPGQVTNSFPTAAFDVARAVQFVRDLAPGLGVDPDRVALIGSSAGANLALWVAVHDDFQDISSSDPVLHQSSRPIAVINKDGPTHLGPAYIVCTGPKLPVCKYFGTCSDTQLLARVSREERQMASPLWVVENSSVSDQELQQLSVLHMYWGNPNITDSSALAHLLPVTNPHDQIFGLLFREAFDRRFPKWSAIDSEVVVSDPAPGTIPHPDHCKRLTSVGNFVEAEVIHRPLGYFKEAAGPLAGGPLDFEVRLNLGQVDANSFLVNLAAGAPGHGLAITFTNELTGSMNRLELAEFIDRFDPLITTKLNTITISVPALPVPATFGPPLKVTVDIEVSGNSNRVSVVFP